MRSLRAFFRDHRKLALGLVLLALCMKALVPGGLMLGTQGKLLTIEVCSDASGIHQTKQISVPMDSNASHEQSGQGKADSACPYSALSMAALGGADMLLLASALAFIIALGFLPMPARPLARASHLRPPLRGPPALA
jgi:hypothetical protein